MKETIPKATTLGTAKANSEAKTRTSAYVRLTIADTGIGMTPETRQHMFEAILYHQSDHRNRPWLMGER